LNKQLETCTIVLTPFDNQRLFSLCGHLDENLKQIEERLEVSISNRGNSFHIKGDNLNVELATRLLDRLYKETKNNSDVTPEKIHLSLQEMNSGFTRKDKDKAKPKKAKKNSIAKDKNFSPGASQGSVTPRTSNQQVYLNNIADHDINFGIGPAGTGKTFLAVACAVEALEQERVSRIILVRPAVEAGERLGFLPGDLSQKIDPYLRPLYDALYHMLGHDKVNNYLERQVIEIAPLAYMRGRTLNDAFIILDESQNTTHEQMKMFLTRIGFSSTAVITGDITQIDLPNGKGSGLKHAIKLLRGIDEISFTFFASSDVVRHPIVQKIINAYDKHENNSNENKVSGPRN